MWSKPANFTFSCKPFGHPARRGDVIDVVRRRREKEFVLVAGLSKMRGTLRARHAMAAAMEWRVSSSRTQDFLQ